MTRRWTRTLMVGVAVVCSCVALARYGHQRFGSLARNADAIMLVEVVGVRGQEVDLRVEEVIRVAKERVVTAGDTIRMTKFQNWTCASRWKPYEAGQRLLAFLSIRDHEGQATAVWSPLGLADEGELPIEGESVYIGGNGDGSPSSEVHMVYGKPYMGREFKLADVLAALKTGSISPELERAPER